MDISDPTTYLASIHLIPDEPGQLKPVYCGIIAVTSRISPPRSGGDTI